MTISLVAAFVLAYLAGSIPFGLIVTKRAGLGDIRSIGSGSIGATNVLRTGRTGLAALTLFLDALKGGAAVLVAGTVGAEAAAVAAVAAVLGHVYPVWLRFDGGKGVATALGVLLVLSWPLALLAMAVWLAAAALFRISSLAALIACAATPVCSWLFADMAGLVHHPLRTLAVAVVAVLVVVRHAGNIRRLLAGQEPRIGQSRAHPADQGD